MSESCLSPVQFHDSILFVINRNNEPYTPMKPIVEGMGLNWASQTAKLNANKERWGIAMIATPSASGDQQTLCMPVRKLPAFMASINPKKVREELRERIRLYQDECDNALWDYWTKGQATRRGRKPGQKALPEAEPQIPARPRFAPRTSLEEIESRLTTLCKYVCEERQKIYVDLLNQLGAICTSRVSPAGIVCSSLGDAVFSLTQECLNSCSDSPLKYSSNPCNLVRDVKAMLER